MPLVKLPTRPPKLLMPLLVLPTLLLMPLRLLTLLLRPLLKPRLPLSNRHLGFTRLKGAWHFGAAPFSFCADPFLMSRLSG